jgi:hypothetical protein
MKLVEGVLSSGALRRSLENKGGIPTIVFLSDEQSKSKLLCFCSSPALAGTAVASFWRAGSRGNLPAGKYACSGKSMPRKSFIIY